MDNVYFLRNQSSGVSINKVAQTISSQIDNRKEFYLPCLTPNLTSIIKNIIFVYRHRDKHGINQIVGGEHYAILGLIGCKSVLVVHDTVSLEYRELPCLKKLMIRYIWYSLPMLFATRIVCISNETKKRIENYTKRRDIVVIHNAIGELFRPSSMPANNIPNILIIGTGENKNLKRTFEALNGLTCEVTIIGQLSEEHVMILRNSKIKYTNKCGLTDEQILDEYINSDIVSFISLFEGFGMIVVEANKVGRPVICSNIPVLKEIAGDAALFVDPTSKDDMRYGFQRLLSDNNLRENLVEKGFINAERFSREKILAQWKTLYSSI